MGMNWPSTAISLFSISFCGIGIGSRLYSTADLWRASTTTGYCPPGVVGRALYGGSHCRASS
ncbi:hypothetical protein LB505_000260 [Fusarium chuoi]|nr:hypothetical protein LB505_000260 [Fusarium chuoi]